jgi:hypothetical protein
MSKVLLDHVPARTPGELAPAPPARASTERPKVEAGVLGLVLIAVLVLVAGFALLFPEARVSSTTWTTYRDPSGVFELRLPAGWVVAPQAAGVRLAGDAMTVEIAVLTDQTTGVDQLARLRVGELADLSAAEVTSVEGTTIAGRPAAAVEELSSGDGQVTRRLYVQAGETTVVTVVATAPEDAFDRATVDAIAGTLAFPAGVDPGVVDQSRP